MDDRPPCPDLYRMLFDTIDDGVCLIERLPVLGDGRCDYRCLAMNPAMRALFGSDDLSGRSLRDAFPREADGWYGDFDRVLEDGEATRFECRLEPQAMIIEMFASRVENGSRRQLLVMMRDVTARRRAEATLRERETDLARVQRIGGVGGLDIDIEDGLRSWRSPEYLRLHGLPPTVSEESHADWKARVHPEDRDRAERALFAALEGRNATYDNEYRIIRRSDGEIRWIHARCDIERDGDGKPLRLVGAHVDVTEQKRMQQALAEREAWLAAQKEAFQIAMDGGSLEASLGVLTRTVTQRTDARQCAFYIANGRRHRITHVVGGSPAADGFEGSSESPGCGLAVTTGEPVITPDVLSEPRWTQWTGLAREHGYRGCWSFPVETAAGRLVGSFVLYFVEPRDAEPRDREVAAMITQTAAIIISRHQENEERIHSDDRFRQFAEASSGALWIRDAETLAMEFASPAIETIYGIEASAMLGDVERWAAMIVPDDRGAALDHIDDAARGKASIHEFRIQRPSDRAFRWIRDTGFPLRDAHGHVQRIGGIAEDVTDAKLSAEHQAVLLAELQHRVRNIMAAIQSIVARTADSAASVPDYAEALSGRLHTLARVQALLTRGANAGVEIAAIVREELSAQAMGAGQFEIGGPDLVLAPKAAETMTLAVHELTTNAVKHGALSKPGGKVEVRWEVVDKGGIPWLGFDWNETGGPASCKPPDARRRGFGTELIEGRVPYELHGRGEMRIEPGGARCHLEFPLRDGASLLETDAPPRADVFGGAIDMSGAADLGGQLILVVEDDYYLATDTVRALKGAGADIVGPCPSEEAAREAIVDVALTGAVLDIDLRGGRSFGIAEELRARGVPFLFITGYDPDVIPDAFKDVARLQKPVPFRQVIGTLADILGLERS